MKRPDVWIVETLADGKPQFARDWAMLAKWLEETPDARERFNWRLIDHCGCCGAHQMVMVYMVDEQFGGDHFLVGGEAPREVEPCVFRCEKHVGRAPCCIDGCGRTFALDAGHGYDVTFICGKHWREAPRYMRDRVKWLRQRAEKLDWPDRLARLYSKAFDRAVRSVREGRRLDMDEINKLFGWDDAA